MGSIVRFAVCALLFLSFSKANDRLMICKPVSSIFEARPINSTNQYPCSDHKCRPGKQGPRGFRGPPGPPGPSGEAANQSEEIARLQTELRQIKRKLQCIDGVLVGNTCYKLARRVGTGMVYEAARNLCAFNGMTLAEIPSEEVYNAVYNYVKSNWYLTTNAVNRNFVRIWLGSSYRKNNRKVILANGQSGYSRWYPGYPLPQTARTHMGFHISINQNDRANGMFNTFPTFAEVSPLCQFELEE